MVLGPHTFYSMRLESFSLPLVSVYFYSPLDGNSVSTEKALTTHRCILTEPWFSPLQMSSQLLLPICLCDELVCVYPLGSCTYKVKGYAFPSVGPIFGIQQKFNKSLIFSMNQGKNGVLEMCKIKFYISHISSITVLDPKLGYRKQIQIFWSSLFHLSQKIQKIQNDVSLRICYDKKQIFQLFFDYVCTMPNICMKTLKLALHIILNLISIWHYRDTLPGFRKLHEPNILCA